jgi:hypothetical protein
MKATTITSGNFAVNGETFGQITGYNHLCKKWVVAVKRDYDGATVECMWAEKKMVVFTTEAEAAAKAAGKTARLDRKAEAEKEATPSREGVELNLMRQFHNGEAARQTWLDLYVIPAGIAARAAGDEFAISVAATVYRTGKCSAAQAKVLARLF